jgi:DNA (cytosine-5)-methyltransferase 1
MMELTHIDLFSGIGGFALAARWNGIKTVQFVEIDKFCQKVLNKNFPGVPIHDDIKTFTITKSRESGEQTEAEWWKDISGGNSEVFLLTGGFPCQPFSCAGKRKGTADSRHLWPEMLRVIKTLKPKWIIGENVAGIINIKSMEQQDSQSGMESETINDGSDSQPSTVLIGILNDLEQAGYSVQIFVIPACAINAPHRRDRVWIVANRASGGRLNGCGDREERHFQNTSIGTVEENKSERNRRLDRIEQTDSHAADTGIEGLQGSKEAGNPGGNGKESTNELSGRLSCWQEPWIEVATMLCRVDDGVRNRVDRLKSLGNAIVPQVADQIIKTILQVEYEPDINRL